MPPSTQVRGVRVESKGQGKKTKKKMSIYPAGGYPTWGGLPPARKFISTFFLELEVIRTPHRDAMDWALRPTARKL